jgi:hypothetical protein
METLQSGQIVTLLEPYRGYRTIELIEKNGYKWTVRIVGTGLEIEVYDDEFIIENNS